MACATESAHPPATSETTDVKDGSPTWEEFRANPPVTWKEFRSQVHRETFAPYPFIVDGDIALYDEAALRNHYEAWLADAYAGMSSSGSALTVRNILGADILWSGSQKNSLTYCISNAFGTKKAAVVATMGLATRSWSDRVAVKFSYRFDQDAACTSTNNNVIFNVTPTTSTSFFALSFFPDDARANRQLLISDDAFTTNSGGRDFQGILRHETGHILGFRHEHIHITCTGEGEVNDQGKLDSRQVTSYDVNSVMHYPQCRPSGTGGYRQTVLDFSGATSLYGNAGRTADLLWRNANTGILQMWLMSGGTILSTPQLQFAEPAEWHIEGMADFDGDGKSDILWRNINTGVLQMWLMSGGTILSTPQLQFAEPPEWQVQGVADFDGDGKSDILWRNSNTGVVQMWLMSGGAILSTPQVPPTRTADWHIEGTADFNGDGKSDILWRNLNTGVLQMWLMSGGTVSSSPQLQFAEPPEWQIQGLTDFDGDGKSDILWRNLNTGVLQMWLMSGGTILSTPQLQFAEPAEWHIERTRDFDGNGKSDILFRNLNTGVLQMWLMSGGTILSTPQLQFSEPSEWQIQGAADFDGPP